MEISARNQIRGTVVSVATDAIVGEVVVRIEPAEIAAVITKRSIDGLALKAGDEVTVIVKSTEVMIGKRD